MEKPSVIPDEHQEQQNPVEEAAIELPLKKKKSVSISSNEDSSLSDYGSEEAIVNPSNSPENTNTTMDKITTEKKKKKKPGPVQRGSSVGDLPSSLLNATTPKYKTPTMVKSTEHLVKEFSPPSPTSMEYSYYVIASPVADRKITHSNRSYSFVSMSSMGSSSSEISSIIQPKKRAPKSRGLLKSVKDQLLKEIENINMELVKMDSEKLILGNLRNASLLYRNMICQSERNNQGIPNAQKLRVIVESIELKIADEELALSDELSIPHIDCVKKDFQEFIKICNLITNNKTNLKISMVEELLCAVGKLYGDVDTLLKIFYEHEDDEFGEEVEEIEEPKEHKEILEEQQEEEVIQNNEIEAIVHNSENAESTITQNTDDTRNLNNTVTLDVNENEVISPVKEYLTSRNRRSVDLNLSPTSSSEENNSNLGKTLKNLSKKLSKAKKLFKTIERMSSGNPKPKSLRVCFSEISSMLDEESYSELKQATEDSISAAGDNNMWSKGILGNINALHDHLRAERPGERELEHIRIIVGELTGRINIMLKSNMLD